MEVSSADNRSFSRSRTPSLAFMTISPPLYTTPKFHFMRTVQAAEFTSGKEFTPERLATNFTSPRILFGLRQPRLDLRVRRLSGPHSARFAFGAIVVFRDANVPNAFWRRSARVPLCQSSRLQQLCERLEKN